MLEDEEEVIGKETDMAILGVPAEISAGVAIPVTDRGGLQVCFLLGTNIIYI
jgi:hypothetical protein